MGTLRDELIKAKLVAKKEAKKIAREVHLKRKENGRDALEKELTERETRYREQIQEKQLNNRRIETENRLKENEQTRKRRLLEIIRSGEIPGACSGNSRFYFVDRNGKIPFLKIRTDIIDDLANGKAAIVLVPDKDTERYTVIHAPAALELLLEYPESLLVFRKRD